MAARTASSAFQPPGERDQDADADAEQQRQHPQPAAGGKAAQPDLSEDEESTHLLRATVVSVGALSGHGGASLTAAERSADGSGGGLVSGPWALQLAVVGLCALLAVLVLVAVLSVPGLAQQRSAGMDGPLMLPAVTTALHWWNALWLLPPTAASSSSPSPASASASPSSASPAAPSASAAVTGSAEQLVVRYEMCPRAASPAEEGDLSALRVSHFLLPHGPFTWPSFNVSAARVRPAVRYVELYVLDVVYRWQHNMLRVAVMALADNQTSNAGPAGDGHYDWDPYDEPIQLIAAQLTARTSEPAVFGRLWLDRVERARGLFWIDFHTQLVVPPDSVPEHFFVDLSHPDLTSSSSSAACGGATASAAAWCAGTDSLPGPSLRVAVCSRRYRFVDFSYCSAPLYSPHYVAHIRSFVHYHAFVGIQRFIVFDHGFYADALRPLVDSGLVDYRYWPVPNRRFSVVWAFAQMQSISICAEINADTSHYFALFDIDEWLSFPQRPAALSPKQQQQLGDSQPAVATELYSDPLRAVFPSSCVSFRYQPLAIDPDVLLDTAAHSSSSQPLLHCQSMLSNARTQWRSYLAGLIAAKREAASRSYVAAVDGGSPEQTVLALKQQLLSAMQQDGGFVGLDAMPLWVFDYMDFRDDAWRKQQWEDANQTDYEAALAQQRANLSQSLSSGGGGGLLSAAALSAPPSFHAASPQRFHTRLGYARSRSKAIYHSSYPAKVGGVWIHPVEPEVRHSAYVDAGLLRLNHYLSINRTRSSLNEDRLQELVTDDEALAVWQALVAHNTPATDRPTD